MDAGVGVGEKREKGWEEGEGLPPQKLVRGQASLPFRMVSPAPAPRPAGTTFFCGNGCDQNQGARALQPLATPFEFTDRARDLLPSAGAADAAVAGWRSFPFTPAQWQELQRQAMIYKHLVASVPVPAELLFPISAASFSAAPFHFLPTTHGGACVNVRFGSGVDPEPGRCRRTDGKKWRCSRDVAPGQKYCERHVHRGRPRSRKPVELHKNKTAPISPAPAAASPTSPGADNPPPRTTMASSLSQPFPVRSTGVIPKPPETKLPFLSMEPNKDPRHLDWMKNDGEDMASSQHWERMQSKISSRSNTSSVMHHYEEELNLNYTDLNDPCFPFLNPDLSSLEEGAIVNHRDPPRSFIDAWSSKGAATSSGRSSVTPAGRLPLSTLSLSIRGIEEDAEQVQMGLGLGDAATSSWMAPGPLGEALQSSNGTSPPNGSGCSKGSCSGLMSLMGKDRSGSQVASPQGSPTTLASSPSGVLHKALVSLSDSSCSSSPTFAAAASSPGEFTLQWMNQSSKQ